MYNAKIGKFEKHQHVYVQMGIEKRKEQIHDEKRSSSCVEQSKSATAQTFNAGRQRAISFLSMSADETFFKAAWMEVGSSVQT